MARNDVLVDADWVEANLDNPQVAIVEVDEDTSAYDKNHIRNAIRIDWTKDLQDPVRRDFVDQEGFEKLLSEKGISNDDTVVLYGDNNNWFAAYAYWYFKLYGHEDVKLLDGGRKKWELDSRDLVGEVPQRATTTYQAKPQNLEVKVKDIENLIHHSASENLLVDLTIDKDARPKRLRYELFTLAGELAVHQSQLSVRVPVSEQRLQEIVDARGRLLAMYEECRRIAQ